MPYPDDHLDVSKLTPYQRYRLWPGTSLSEEEWLEQHRDHIMGLMHSKAQMAKEKIDSLMYDIKELAHQLIPE